MIEEWRNIKVHEANMNAKLLQVNARLFCAAISAKTKHVIVGQCGHSPKPIPGKGPPGFDRITPRARGEPQISLRQREANAEVARAAPGAFTLAQRCGLRGDLRPRL